MKNIFFLSVVAGATLLAGCSNEVEDESLTKTCDGPWVAPKIVDTPTADWFGEPGVTMHAGLERLTKDPFNKDFILADVNFNQKRWFTNFSGDISGRFIEVASAVSTRAKPWPPVLTSVLDEIVSCQKEDGHFGVPIDWNKPIDFDPTTDQTVMMPTLWGNGRLFLGLTTAAERFGRADILNAAKKLGDFYVNTVYPRFCDPNKMSEYKTEGQYASAYVTCVFEGMEGLVNLYLLTKDQRYLDTACKMADFNEPFDVVPVGHSHGSLSQSCALMRIYEVTGQDKYLQRVIKRWEEVVSGGYVNPTGGVLEKFWVKNNRDEGCSEADWLRLNLLLWKETGITKYLDMAERLLWNEIIPNQWNTGGFGHRFIACDDQGPYAFMKPSQESLWCCTFHVDLALHQMVSYLALGTDQGIWYNFPMYFSTVTEVNGATWLIKSNPTDTSDRPEPVIGVTVELMSELGTPIPSMFVRVPFWADNVQVFAYRTGDEKEKLDVTVQESKVQGRNILNICTSERMEKETMKYTILYSMKPFIEDRKFNRLDVAKMQQEGIETLTNVVVHQGPLIYMNKNSGEIETIAYNQITEKMEPYIALTNKWDPHAFVCNILLK